MEENINIAEILSIDDLPNRVSSSVFQFLVSKTM